MDWCVKEEKEDEEDGKGEDWECRVSETAAQAEPCAKHELLQGQDTVLMPLVALNKVECDTEEAPSETIGIAKLRRGRPRRAAGFIKPLDPAAETSTTRNTHPKRQRKRRGVVTHNNGTLVDVTNQFCEPPSYMCDTCGERFTVKQRLKRHQVVHSDERPHSCDICKKRFSRKSPLIEHRRIHSSEKPYYCKICQKHYGRKSSLNKHNLTYHSGNSTVFTCDICKKEFCSLFRLSTHMHVHTGGKLFTCEICNKKFSYNYTLKTHMRIHSGEEPFTCDICKKHYSRKDTLTNHMKLHSSES